MAAEDLGQLIAAERGRSHPEPGHPGSGTRPARNTSSAAVEGAAVDESPEDVIRKELSPPEQLLWSGQPRQGIVRRAADAILIPFSVLWGGFAIFWEAMVIAGGAPFFFALWGIPFVLAGLYIMVGQFWVDARQRAATTYGVTSERVVIVSGLWSRGVKSLNIDTLTDVSLDERSNGAGTVTFGSMPFMHGWFASAA
jgi:hypothetical protein